MDLIEAKIFVKKILEDAFPNGRADILDQFYTPDVKVYFNDETYGLDDIRNRVLSLKKHTEKCHFLVNNVLVFHQYIAFSCQQNWVNKADKTFHDLLVFGIYHMRNDKVCEVWQILDANTNAYDEVAKNFTEHMRPFKVNEKDKQNFLRRLNASITPSNKESIQLADNEKECLYYYLNGFSAKETAQEIPLSARTIEKYLANIKVRLDCSTKSELRRKLFQEV